MADKGFDDYPDSLSTSDGVRIDTICVNWQNTAASSIVETFVESGVGFDRTLGGGYSSCIDELPPGAEILDCLSAFTMFRAQYRYFDGSDGHGMHASVVLNSTVDSGAERPGVHWMELRSADGDSGWSLFQEGTHSPPDSSARWMGSIAQDGDRNIALGYSRSSTSDEPSLYYAMRERGDTPGSLGAETVCHDGTGYQQSTAGRWGDYSSMSVDPQDDCTFWFTGEYYESMGSFDWKTRICSFDLCNFAPTVAIGLPADGAEFANTFSILFDGTATDEDGDLTSGLAWTSNLDGAIGAGGSFTSTLSAGAHTIATAVTDSTGKTGSDQIELTVTAPGCPAHLDVGPGTISGALTARAVNTIDVVDGTAADATAVLDLLASQSVSFVGAFSLDAGAVLTVTHTASPCI